MLHKVLSIAGFDSSGGAGLQADLKTFSAFGCYGMTILTALPIQNTCGVTNCYSIPIRAISEQLEAIFGDITPDAIKIGMLFNSEVITLVADFLAIRAKNIPIVLDPVMVAKSGDNLLLPESVAILKKRLIPHVSLITPNIAEAEVLSGIKIKTEDDMLIAGMAILNLGAKALLVKGGHLMGNYANDLLLTHEYHEWLSAPRIITKNTHGTGCTLSAAIASSLALGLNLTESCKLAKSYLTKALQAFQHESIGHGHGPVHHFYHLWPTLDKI